MRKLILKHGLISGAVLCLFTSVMMPLCMNGVIDFDASEVLGYSTMVLAFLMVFFGIRAAREDAGGAISFGRAFRVGILIALVACAVYVVSWEIVYFNFLPDFVDKYSAFTLEKLRAKGGSVEELETLRQQNAHFKELYANPLFNVGMTFLEVFPVGLVVTLVSAAILRRKAAPSAPVGATPANNTLGG